MKNSKISTYKKLSYLLFPILFFAIGMYFMPMAIMGNNLDYIPGDLGDARLNNYFLEQGFKWLIGEEYSFWNAPFFYPAYNVMAFSDNHLGTLPFYAIFRFAKLDRETAFQAWILTMFILNYISCFLVLRKLSFSFLSASAGAFVFSFSLPMIARLGHAQLLPRFMVPVGFFCVWNYMKKYDLRLFAGLCFSIVWQFYCTIYIGLFMVYMICALIVSYLIVDYKSFSWKDIFWGSPRIFLKKIIILVISAFALLPLFFPYIDIARDYGLRHWCEISNMLPRWQSYLTPYWGSLLWSWLRPIAGDLPMRWEHQMFVGIVPWMAFFATILICFRKRSSSSLAQLGKTSVLCFLFLFLLTLHVSGFALYELILWIPGVASVRAVSRIGLVLSFLFAIFVAIAFSRIESFAREKGPYIRCVVFSLLILFLTLDQSTNKYYRFIKAGAQQRLQRIISKINAAGFESNVFAYMPARKEKPYIVQLDAMMAAQILNMATVNGHSGILPHNYSFHDSYDQLAKLSEWMKSSTRKYRSYYRKFHFLGRYDSLFDNLVVVRGQSNGRLTVDWFGLDYVGSTSIRAADGRYVQLERDGNGELSTDKRVTAKPEVFNFVYLGKNLRALRVGDGKYVCAESGGGRELVANRSAIGEWEKFVLVELAKGEIALRASGGQYVTIKKGRLLAASNSIGQNETFRVLRIR